MNMTNFKWINESTVRITDDGITIAAPAHTDFFCGGSTSSEEGLLPDTLCNAPYYYTEVTGDFILQAKVSHDFIDTYDSASLMVMIDMDNWAKCCFELTDFGTHAIVSVVTKNAESDDANGCDILNQNYVWLRICRVGQAFSFHYSTDGNHFHMTRCFLMHAGNAVKVGMLAQAPTGSGGERNYEEFTIKNETVKNIRSGK